MSKILLIANTSWYLYNFRKSLIKSILNNGYHVMCLAPADRFTEKLISLGAEYINIEYDNSSKNPVGDFLFLIKLIVAFKKHRPNSVLSFTIKANIYGGIAARFCKTPIIANVSGLGSLFISDGIMSRLPLIMYRIGLSREDKIFFQNIDDRNLFIENNVVSCQETDILPGSGVNLEWFSNGHVKKHDGRIVFLLAARLLKDKGVMESVEAIESLRKSGQRVELQLLGQIWIKNPSAVSQIELEKWVESGLVTYLGFTEDVRHYIKNADVVMLPSYREGMAKILIEAASMGKPLITTDVPGCKELIEDGVTGFLCRARDSKDLMQKMQRMIDLSQEERIAMGKRGRLKMEREFDEKIVIDKYLESISALTKHNK